MPTLDQVRTALVRISRTNLSLAILIACAVVVGFALHEPIVHALDRYAVNRVNSRDLVEAKEIPVPVVDQAAVSQQLNDLRSQLEQLKR